MLRPTLENFYIPIFLDSLLLFNPCFPSVGMQSGEGQRSGWAPGFEPWTAHLCCQEPTLSTKLLSPYASGDNNSSFLLDSCDHSLGEDTGEAQGQAHGADAPFLASLSAEILPGCVVLTMVGGGQYLQSRPGRPH